MYVRKQVSKQASERVSDLQPESWLQTDPILIEFTFNQAPTLVKSWAPSLLWLLAQKVGALVVLCKGDRIEAQITALTVNVERCSVVLGAKNEQ